MTRPDHERYHRHGPSSDAHEREARELRCSRSDDPTQHDAPHVSPFVRRALAGELPAKVLA